MALGSGGKGNLLEHGVVVETQIILDHAIGNVAGHLILRHMMPGEVHARKARAVDAGGELILVARKLHLRLSRGARARGADRRSVRVVSPTDNREVRHVVDERRSNSSVGRRREMLAVGGEVAVCT